MDTISFTCIPPESSGALQRVFRLIKDGKESGKIEEDLVRDALGENLDQFVGDPAVIQQLMERWRRDRSTPIPWEFGSWIDALTSCELLFHSLQLQEDGSGELHFEQLAWPSGGL